MQPLLEGKQISKYFGGLAAVKDVDFAVYPGEIVGLVGPNGSGKTTLFDCLSGVQKIDAGRVYLDGREITKTSPHQIARLGLARTFQVNRIYRGMTVLENMLVSRQWRGTGILNMLRPSQASTEDRARELIEFLLLSHLVDDPAGELSGGQRRLLEIGMALMSDSSILLLDEATSGINPTFVETIKDRIRILNREQGKTFLLVEHNLHFISDLCSRVYVLNYGEKLAEGTPDEIQQDELVIEAYFGLEE